MRVVDDATGTVTIHDPDGSTRAVRVIFIEYGPTSSMGRLDFPGPDPLFECKVEGPGGPYGQPHQTRPSRSKNKVAWWKRVARRRRRTQLAKAQKKHLKQVTAAKERERERAKR